MANKFRSTDVRFKDTRKAGSITIRGISLEPDEDGFIEGPSDLAKEVAPHGFLQEGSAAYNEWLATQPKQPAPASQSSDQQRRR